MMFGLQSKSRFICVDIQHSEVFFVVVQKKGDFFEIDFSHKISADEGLFDSFSIKNPGKIADVLRDIQQKFGVLPIITTIPELFCYTSFLVGEDAVFDAKKIIQSLIPKLSYIWKDSFNKKHIPHISFYSAEKKVCDEVYGLIKSLGFSDVTMFPRALALAHVPSLENSIVCDIGKNQITISSIYNSRNLGFSIVPYGVTHVFEKMKKKFSLTDEETKEVFSVYGTDALSRKNAHTLHALLHTFLVPMIDEINSLEVRRNEYGFESAKKLCVIGTLGQYKGVIEDVCRMSRLEEGVVSAWEDVIDFESHIPHIHKNNSYEYVGIAGLMNILKKGTRYEPFDL